MKVDYDVIIIGAGPAGVSCAKQLVDNGVKTLIIEKNKLPRLKCCSGLFTERSLGYINDNFGKIPDNIFCDAKKIGVKFSKSGRTYYKLENMSFSSLQRDKFDYWLITNSNAEVFENITFRKFIKENNIIKVICYKADKLIELTCNYLIAADGAYSKVRRLIDPNYKKENLRFAIQNVYEYNDKVFNDDYHVIMNEKYAGDCFAWILIKNNLLYIGSGIKKGINYLNSWLQFVNKFHNLSLKYVRKEFSYIDYFFEKNKIFLGDSNILIIGEAAGLMSIFGEGITSALYSGYYAALAIIQTKSYNKLIESEIDLIEKKWKEIK